MKAKLLHDMAVLRSNFNLPGVVDIFVNGSATRGYPVGHIIDHPDAYILVKNGDAEAADEECEAKAGYAINPTAVAAQERIAREHVDIVDESRSEDVEVNDEA